MVTSLSRRRTSRSRRSSKWSARSTTQQQIKTHTQISQVTTTKTYHTSLSPSRARGTHREAHRFISSQHARVRRGGVEGCEGHHGAGGAVVCFAQRELLPRSRPFYPTLPGAACASALFSLQLHPSPPLRVRVARHEAEIRGTTTDGGREACGQFFFLHRKNWALRLHPFPFFSLCSLRLVSSTPLSTFPPLSPSLFPLPSPFSFFFLFPLGDTG